VPPALRVVVVVVSVPSPFGTDSAVVVLPSAFVVTVVRVPSGASVVVLLLRPSPAVAVCVTGPAGLPAAVNVWLVVVTPPALFSSTTSTLVPPSGSLVVVCAPPFGVAAVVAVPPPGAGAVPTAGAAAATKGWTLAACAPPAVPLPAAAVAAWVGATGVASAAVVTPLLGSAGSAAGMRHIMQCAEERADTRTCAVAVRAHLRDAPVQSVCASKAQSSDHRAVAARGACTRSKLPQAPAEHRQRQGGGAPV
jgi:hypothetical protein